MKTFRLSNHSPNTSYICTSPRESWHHVLIQVWRGSCLITRTNSSNFPRLLKNPSKYKVWTIVRHYLMPKRYKRHRTSVNGYRIPTGSPLSLNLMDGVGSWKRYHMLNLSVAT